MERFGSGQLVGSEIHGFRTIEDLDVGSMIQEAKERWLRPNEIHAILCNYQYFNVKVKPVNLPESGTTVLFDRKKLRNFRKDGHNWKKKNDGKTVKEAHEHLKVGNEERIHVYYAHGEGNSAFVRRCYWLLDKTLENIVLVHYREVQECSPATPVTSNSSSALSEENVSSPDQAYPASGKSRPELNDSIRNHELRLHEINTLEWDELLVRDDPSRLIKSQAGNITCFDKPNQYGANGYGSNMLFANSRSSQANYPLPNKLTADSPSAFLPGEIEGYSSFELKVPTDVCDQAFESQIDSNSARMDPEYGAICTIDYSDTMGKETLRSDDSFGRWMNDIMTDSPEALDNYIPTPESSFASGKESFSTGVTSHHQSLLPEQIFSITEMSPAWALSNEETKILFVGHFHEHQQHLLKSSLFCVCGDVCIPAEIVQPGVFRCLVPPHNPGFVNIYLSFDGQKPISQVLVFEYRSPPMQNWNLSYEEKPDWEAFRVQMRLARLLFCTSKTLNTLSNKVSQKCLKDAKTFASRTSHIIDKWEYFIKTIGEDKVSFPQAKHSLLELTLQNRLLEWLLERVVEGRKVSDHDHQGQGVIHLCAILNYTWAVYPFLWSGLSLDYRDKFGWTALHWAAHYGREKMVATLLSAGAKPNLVTDPTKENPGGCTAADLASKSGYEGLSAYLAEKALVAHFEDMSIAGNVSGSLQNTIPSSEVSVVNPEGSQVTDDEIYLKDSLNAYRTAADAASRIQAAFREQSFKLRTKAVRFSNPEEEARSIIAAMKIQHAFRNHETRKQMAAAARIQYRFRSWKIRKDFLNMRRQAIKIQSVFRGFQVRKQYKKVLWSVGILEKAILRWRLKRKGLRGLQVAPNDSEREDNQESDVEDFFRTSRKQAEDRVERSVVRVQAMFRSKRAQEEYRRMKIAHDQAMLEYEGLHDPAVDMEK